MLTTPETIRTLQRKLYRKAKQEPACRFHSLYDNVYRKAGLALPDEEFQTLSGLLVNQLGRVPYPGEEIALPGVVYQVLDADHRRIYRLAMKKIPPQSG